MEHETIVIERVLEHAVTEVFGAWADPHIRSAWAPPLPGHVVIYDAADFRVGGLDRSRCGPAANPDVDVVARYLSIVDNERIVFSEAVSQAVRELSASLVSVGFAGSEALTELSLTVQLTSFTGEIAEGHRRGWTAALNNLAALLAVRSA